MPPAITRFSIFGRTKTLENKLDNFFDKIIEAGIVFKQLLNKFLAEGVADEFRELAEQLHNIEGYADHLRREIEAELYEQNLIPDIRVDVLSLVEDMDDILNSYYSNGHRFSIEKPDIPDDLYPLFLELVDKVNACVENAVMAGRSFLREIYSVRDYSHKVMFYETQADKVGTKIKTAAFDSDLSLAHKIHIRDFDDYIDSIADMAEDIADDLAIYTIKRRV